QVLDAVDVLFFFSSRRRHTRFSRDWSSDVCSSDLDGPFQGRVALTERFSHFVLGLVSSGLDLLLRLLAGLFGLRLGLLDLLLGRSEERRVGREWRSQGAPRRGPQTPASGPRAMQPV